MTRDRYEGCLLGLALADALGAAHEGSASARLLWMLIGHTRTGKLRWTDDTQMALDVADSLISRGKLSQDDITARFVEGYAWSRGYGPGTTKLLKSYRRGATWRNANCSVYPGGSLGNGAATRAAMIGLFYARQPDLLPEAARQSAEVTHAHALGMEGALLVAAATALALTHSDPMEIVGQVSVLCTQAPFQKRLAIATNWLHVEREPPIAEVREQLGTGMAASESCVTALYVAMRFRNRTFEELLSFVAQCRGDVNTIGAMAGALWGAMRGEASLPGALLRKLEQRERLVATAGALFEKRL